MRLTAPLAVSAIIMIATKCLRLSFRALRGNEIMQLRKIHAFFLLSRHLPPMRIRYTLYMVEWTLEVAVHIQRPHFLMKNG